MLKLQKGGKPITPARVFRAIQSRVLDRLQPINANRGVFSSFAEAEQHAPRTKPLGYDDAASDDWYLQKLTGVQLEDYPAVYWLREAFTDSRSVLEIGGHVGVAYYGFSRILRYPAGLRWTILDVPSVAAAGRALATERQRDDLSFVTDLADAPAAEILLAAGSLQYLEHTTLVPILKRLSRLPRHLIINVTPVYDGPSFVTLQNIGTAYCPYRVFNRLEFIGALESLGYRLGDSWAKPRSFRVPGRPERSFEGYSGFYLKNG